MRNNTNLDDFVFVGLWFRTIIIHGRKENTNKFRNVKRTTCKILGKHRKAITSDKEPSKSCSLEKHWTFHGLPKKNPKTALHSHLGCLSENRFPRAPPEILHRGSCALRSAARCSSAARKGSKKLCFVWVGYPSSFWASP